jgi:hypothetical protein
LAKKKETGIYDMSPKKMPPKGMHKMPDGHMMKDSEMPMMKKKGKK